MLIPKILTVPQTVSRSSMASANFLCNNFSYILGLDNKGKPERSKECFACAKKNISGSFAGGESGGFWPVFSKIWKQDGLLQRPM